MFESSHRQLLLNIYLLLAVPSDLENMKIKLVHFNTYLRRISDYFVNARKMLFLAISNRFVWSCHHPCLACLYFVLLVSVLHQLGAQNRVKHYTFGHS